MPKRIKSAPSYVKIALFVIVGLIRMADRKNMMYWFSIVLVVLSNVAYHIVQKNTPETVSPSLTLAATYFTAAVLCFGAYLLFPGKQGFLAGFHHLNWTALALGVAIIGLELGFLLAYRSGWQVSTAALVANIAVAILLLPIGLIFFREALKPVHMAGIVLCVAGLVCVSWKV